MSIINNMPNLADGTSSINGLIEEYYVYAGENISAGDLVEFINGIAKKQDYGVSEQIDLSPTNYCGMAPWALELPDGRIFISHAHTTNAYVGCSILSINGITITTLSTTQLAQVSSGVTKTRAILLSTGNVFIGFNNGQYCRGIVVSIEGNTITAGEVAAYGNSGGSFALCAIGVPGDRVFIPYAYNTSNYYLYGLCLTITGTTISVGTGVELWDGTNAGLYVDGLCLPSGVPFIVHSMSDSLYLRGMLVPVIDGIVYGGSNQSIDTGSNAGTDLGVTLTTDNNVLVVHDDSQSNGVLEGVIIQSDGTSFSWGTHVSLGLNVPTTASAQISMKSTDNNKVVMSYSDATGTAYLYGIILLTEGLTITLGGEKVQLSGDSAGGRGTSVLILPNRTILITGTRSGGSRYLRGQIWMVNEEINQLTNEIKYEETETQVRKLTTSKIEGVAKTSGEGAPLESMEVEVIKTGNLFPTSWTQVTKGTKYTSGGFTIIADDYYDSNNLDYYADNISDGDVTSEWMPDESGNSITIICPYPVKVTKMKTRFYYGNPNYPSTFVIKGSKNGSEWTDLYTVTETQYGLRDAILNNTDYYSYYRVTVEGFTVEHPSIHEFQTSEYVEIQQISNTEHKDKIQVYVPFTGYNLIPDASFENNQWNDANYSTEVYRLGSRALYFPVGTTYVATIPIDRPIIGHKYYGRRYIKTNGNNTPADCRFEMFAGDGEGLNWVFAWNQGNYPEWGFDSAIHEVTVINYDESTQTIIRCFNVNTTADTWVDDLLLVDLTAMFGAGHEPSKEWCDDNL